LTRFRAGPNKTRPNRRDGVDRRLDMGTAERRLREREDRRRSIMSATACLLMRSGYEALNTNAIAEEADVAVGTVYLYFRNKEEILLHILKEGAERIRSLVAEAARGPDPVEAVGAIGRAYVGYALENPEFFHVQQHFHHGAFVRSLPKDVHKAWLPAIYQISRDTIAIVRERIAAAQRAGQLEPTLDAHEQAVLGWATLNGVLGIAANPEMLAISELSSEALVHGGLRTLLRQLEPSAGPRRSTHRASRRTGR
jgi:AcrR family transcriptional regulator